jgi:hypothetical protein
MTSGLQQLGFTNIQDPRSIEELTTEEFRQIVRPDLPTVGVPLSNFFNDFLLLAAATGQLRESGIQAANVAFLSPFELNDTTIRRYSNGESRLSARSGVIVAPNGNWHHGQFHEPIEISMLADTFGTRDSFTPLLDRHGIATLNPFPAVQSLKSKHATRKILHEIGIGAPEGVLLPKEILSNTEVKAIFEKVHELLRNSEATEFVLKPDSSSCGIGVGFHIGRNPLEIVDRILRKTLRTDSDWVLEERIHSFPMHNRFGQRRDWNLRVLGSTDGIIDIESRDHLWGRAVNKYQGARIRELVDTINALDRENRPTFSEVFDATQNVTERICSALGVEFVGVDEVWTPNRQPIILEVNAGRAGGLGTLFKLRDNDSDRLRGPRKMIQHLTRKLSEVPPPSGKIVEEIPLIGESTLTCYVEQSAFDANVRHLRSHPISTPQMQNVEQLEALVDFAVRSAREGELLPASELVSMLNDLNVLKGAPDLLWDIGDQFLEVGLGETAARLVDEQALRKLAVQNPQELLTITAESPRREAFAAWRGYAFSQMALKGKAAQEYRRHGKRWLPKELIDDAVANGVERSELFNHGEVAPGIGRRLALFGIAVALVAGFSAYRQRNERQDKELSQPNVTPSRELQNLDELAPYKDALGPRAYETELDGGRSFQYECTRYLAPIRGKRKVMEYQTLRVRGVSAEEAPEIRRRLKEEFGLRIHRVLRKKD